MTPRLGFDQREERGLASDASRLDFLRVAAERPRYGPEGALPMLVNRRNWDLLKLVMAFK